MACAIWRRCWWRDDMNRLTRSAFGLAVGLASLAGYVDAVGFLQLRGLFVSFMSGNSTQLAVGLAKGAWPAAGLLAGVLLLFVAGTFVGTLIHQKAPAKGRVPSVLSLTAALLLAAGLFQLANLPIAVVICITLAMGAENAAFQRDGEVVLGLTYMTGTLVKVGQKIANSVTGGERFGWLPHLILWFGLVGGGVLGAFAFLHFGLVVIWIAGLVSLLLSLHAWRAGITAS